MQCKLKQIFILDLVIVTKYLASTFIILLSNPSVGPSPRILTNLPFIGKQDRSSFKIVEGGGGGGEDLEKMSATGWPTEKILGFK